MRSSNVSHGTSTAANILGVGELGLYHFAKNGNQPVIRYPPNFEPFAKVVDLIAKRGRWILLHAETLDPDGVSYEDDFFSGIALMHKRNPNLKLIIVHTATINPDNVRRMLNHYPQLMMDIKIIRWLKHLWHIEPMNNTDRDLHEDWAGLIETMPERLMVGTDNKFFWRVMNVKKYKRRTTQWRDLLGTLKPKTARMIAYENAKRLFWNETR